MRTRLLLSNARGRSGRGRCGRLHAVRLAGGFLVSSLLLLCIVCWGSYFIRAPPHHEAYFVPSKYRRRLRSWTRGRGAPAASDIGRVDVVERHVLVPKPRVNGLAERDIAFCCQSLWSLYPLSWTNTHRTYSHCFVTLLSKTKRLNTSLKPSATIRPHVAGLKLTVSSHMSGNSNHESYKAEMSHLGEGAAMSR